MQNTESAMIKEERRAESVCDNSISGVEAVRAERICDVFRMLSEPSRLKIVLTLLSGELCVYHILQAVGGTQSVPSLLIVTLWYRKILCIPRPP